MFFLCLRWFSPASPTFQKKCKTGCRLISHSKLPISLNVDDCLSLYVCDELPQNAEIGSSPCDHQQKVIEGVEGVESVCVCVYFSVAGQTLKIIEAFDSRCEVH